MKSAEKIDMKNKRKFVEICGVREFLNEVKVNQAWK